MKKLINLVLIFTFIVTHMIIELYPAIKVRARIYVNELDFSSLLNAEPVAEYTACFSDEEKAKLIKMMMNYCNNVLD